jgi:glycine cleavage system H protein
MSEIPADLKFTREHEWVRRETDGTAAVGITDHAQGALGDLVFIELPEPGVRLAAGDACAVVESVKAASDVYSPLSGTVAAVNASLAHGPELVNQDPYGEGWLFRVQLESPEELEELLTADEYAELLAEAED